MGLPGNERADASIARGQQLEDAGDFTGAERCFREALAAVPRYPRAHLNLGNALDRQGRLEESLAAHRAALALDPAFVGAHYNAGVVLIKLKKFGEARDAFERALELDPRLADAAMQIARTHEEQRDLAGACRQIERAVAIEPALPHAWANLGMLRLERKQFAEAETALREALRLDPRNTLASAGLGQFLMERGRAHEAGTLLRHAIDADPDPILWSAYLFSLNLRDDVDAETVARAHFEFGRCMERTVAPAKKAPRPDTRGRRIRIGYVSGDLLAHPVAWFLAPVLQRHDRDTFEVFCYSNGHADSFTDQLRALRPHWRDVLHRGDGEVTDLIRRDGIDVLVDLSGHTTRNRLGVFAARAAPVQATWLGYLNTTGLANMDYRIVDRFTDPEGTSEKYHSETLARMPHSQWCYAPHQSGPLKPLRDEHGARPIVFGSFNQVQKLSDGCLDLWCEILRRVPGSRIRVLALPNAAAGNDVLARLEQRGIERSRVVTRERVSIAEYLATIEDCDIALDTLPYNGGTTTFDSLWMGVPLVALAGDRGIGRGAFSIASVLGLPELIAQTAAEYVERNVRLATDHAWRLALRRTLRPRLLESALLDAPRFTRDLEALYRGMLDGR
jgi:predicted O-linked N-acetylglucosamine transferase (SPINDLY family)